MRAPLVFVACAVLATIAACGQKPETRNARAEAEGAPAAVRATPSEAATAPAPPLAKWPRRKPGLWTQTMTLKDKDFTRRFRFCVDQTSDERMGLDSQGDDGRCRRTSTSRGADGSWTVVSTCDMGPGGRSESTIHVLGDFNTRYVMEVASVTTGAAQPAMNGENRMSMTAEWSGACPAGWSGGDVEMPGGQRMNLLNREVAGG